MKCTLISFTLSFVLPAPPHTARESDDIVHPTAQPSSTCRRRTRIAAPPNLQEVRHGGQAWEADVALVVHVLGPALAERVPRAVAGQSLLDAASNSISDVR